MSVNEDSLVSYALGHLSAAEEAVVEAHLRAHPDDAGRVAGYLDTLAELVMALPPEPLPADAEDALLARVRGSAVPVATPVVTLPEPTGRRRGGVAAWGLATLTAAAVAAALYVTVFAPSDSDARVARALRDYRAEAGAVSYTLSRGQASRGQAEPLGTLVRLQDGRVFVALDAPPAAGRVYQAWEIADAPVSLGTFDGRTFLSTEAVTVGNTFGLTLEPPGGSDQPTGTPITLTEL